jgi:hypothetical protein
MKTDTTKVIEYVRPEIDVIDVKMDSVVCQSPCIGEIGDNTDDEL